MLESQRSENREMANIHVILISLFTIMVIYDYCFTTNPTVVMLKDPKFSLLGPYNTSEYPANDIFDQLIDIKKFSFLKNPQPCEKYSAGLLLIVIVSSNPVNVENRMVIRNTWGKSVDSTKVVFMMGESENSSISNIIDNESKTFGDIVQGTFKDAYRNMTYKHVMGLKWVAHYCPKAKYVLKTDDDIVVNSREMRRFLAKELSPWGAKELIACQVLEHVKPQRWDTSKWKVTTAEYGLNYYPTYCAGWVVLYSQDAVSKLLEAAQVTPYFWIDDVHVTGFLAEKVGIHRTSVNNLILSRARADLYSHLGPKYVGNFLFGPTDITASKMMQIWKAIPA